MQSTLLATAAACAAAFALAAAHADDGRCKNVHAQLHEVQTSEGCTTHFCAAGTIDGNRGFDGTTFFTLDSAVAGPPTSPGSVAYSGIFEITTRRGKLTLRETGVSISRPSHPDGALQASAAQVLSGTERFANASGQVYFTGTGKNGRFTVDMAGVVCFDR